MRFEGTIHSWNDDRGFGFIQPTQGGQEVFVHIKAFRGLLQERPQVHQRVSFAVEMGPQGKKRAVQVELVRATSRPPAGRAARPRSDTPRGASWNAASVWALVLGAAVLLAGYGLGRPPRWTLGLYLGASVVTFLAYAIDKSAARRGAWRIAERKLHWLALVGGWPGALVAQQVLRHKSTKAEFRTVFWATVVLNLAGFCFLASPYARVLGHLS